MPGGRLEIALDQLRANDQILIQTAFSAYVFLVIDPAKPLGLVVGGVFGDYAAEASLEVLSIRPTSRLRVGLCARFHVESPAGCRRITTSVITNLLCRRAGATANLGSAPRSG
jgi:hypothetical protein